MIRQAMRGEYVFRQPRLAEVMYYAGTIAGIDAAHYLALRAKSLVALVQTLEDLREDAILALIKVLIDDEALEAFLELLGWYEEPVEENEVRRNECA